MLRVWQDKLKRREASSFEIDAALADIARSGEDLQRLSRPVTLAHRNSRLPVSQPPPVLAVTNTVLSPVMQESRPREPSLTVLAERAVTSRERQRSMIDPSQVKEAIRLTNNPPSQVNQNQNGTGPRIESRDRYHVSDDYRASNCRDDERGEDQTDRIEGLKDHANGVYDHLCNSLETKRLGSSNQDIQRIDPSQPANDSSVFRGRFIPDISVTPSSTLSSGKARDQEMNDEGFEETQSLVSETLSQETSSGNYETDTHDSTRCSPAELRYTGNDNDRGRVAATDEETDDAAKTTDKALKSSIRGFVKRANSMRSTNEKSSYLPKRTNSLKRESSVSKKGEPTQRNSNGVFQSNSQQRNEVERSGSRSSLRSSRSSLNSATSVNTVRNLVPHHSHLRTYTTAICALTNDLRKSPANTPLPPKSAEKRRTNPRSTVSRIPASRSSSSGSSVGPAARTVRKSVGVSREFFCRS